MKPRTVEDRTHGRDDLKAVLKINQWFSVCENVYAVSHWQSCLNCLDRESLNSPTKVLRKFYPGQTRLYSALLWPLRPVCLAGAVWYGMCRSCCAGTKHGLQLFLMSDHSHPPPPPRHGTDGVAKPFALFEIPYLSASTAPVLQVRDNAGRPGAGRRGEGQGGCGRRVLSRYLR